MDVKDKLETRDIICPAGMPAYLALPSGTGKVPVVINLHDRYGHVRHQRETAERLAREGYVGLAPNMFYKHPDQAAIHANKFHYDMTDTESIEYMADALAALKKDVPRADLSRVAVSGTGQTGRHPYVTASALPIHAILTWYGAANAKNFKAGKIFTWSLDDVIAKIPCPVHAMFGETCHSHPVADVLALRNVLERYKKSYTIKILRDAPHGFFNDTMPGRYRKAQAETAWASQMAFLKEVLSPGYDRSRVIQRFESDISVDYDFAKNIRYD